MQATNLKTNHLTQPLGIDAGTLFLSWQCAEGVRQTAYEIEVTAGAETLWASGKALGSVMHTETLIAVPPKTQGRWRIRLWDENDQPGAWSTASFETGLAQADWQGVWACPETALMSREIVAWVLLIPLAWSRSSSCSWVSIISSLMIWRSWFWRSFFIF